MSTITTPSVSPNDLIESSWGNSVRTDLTSLNTDKAELSGATFTGHVEGITPTSAAHLTRKDYVDGVVAGLLSASGGTVTGGSITIATSGQGINLPSGEPSSAARAARKDYVDTQVATRLSTTGGTVTGSITISTSGQGVNLPTGEPTAANRAVRKDYVDALIAGVLPLTGGSLSGLLSAGAGVNVPAPTDNSKATNKFYVDSLIAGRLSTSGGVLSGAVSVNDSDVPNVSSGGAASMQSAGRFLNTVETSGIQNLWLKRYSNAADTAQAFIAFVRTLSNTTIGSVTIASTSAVAYNTTSDPRTKARLGAITDALARVRRLGGAAFRGHFHDDPDRKVWDFLSSHDIEDVAPYAVTGDRDAVDGEGNIVSQLADHSKLVPLLCAAVAELADLVGAR